MPEESAEEQRALIERIKRWPPLKRAEALSKLLDFLFENRARPVSAKYVEEKHFGSNINSPKFNDNRTRVQIRELKEKLKQYGADHQDESLKVELPDAIAAGGYQLTFERAEGLSACKRFWAPHLDSEKPVNVVCDPLLFFWDPEEKMMFRFMDTNIEGVDRKTALKELKNLHEKAYKDTLTPGHLYIDVGSVAGADLVRTYFKSAGADVALHMDKERRDWRRGSPIVIGNLRTSSALRGIFESSDSDGLAYRLDEKRYAWMHIRKPDDPEIEALRAIGVEVKPEGDFTMPSRDINFGVVSRLPNPSGSGVMTFICSDGTFAAMQMALALTKEDQLRSFFNRMGWRIDRPVPDTFEMLFHVRLWPGGMHDQGSEAKLVCWRPHPG